MMFDKIISEAVEASKQNTRIQEGDYKNEEGLWMCGKCNTPKQGRYVVPFGTGIVEPFFDCDCERERKEKEEALIRAAKEKAERMERIAKLRVNGIHDENIRTWTFENADETKNPELLKKARKYFEQWDEMYENNIGLLLFGNVGTGKTYGAACIANALIDIGIPVLMTKFTKILKDLTGFSVDNKNEYIRSLNNYELLVIDDLGVERESDFALEQVFDVIDSRYMNGQPLIVTTNLSIEDLRNPKDMKYKRIYDRVLEMTIPVKVDGVSLREQNHRDKIKLARQLLAD